MSLWIKKGWQGFGRLFGETKEPPLETLLQPYPPQRGFHKYHRIHFANKGEKEPTAYTIQAFEEIAGMRYLTDLAFQNPKTRKTVTALCAEAAEEEKISRQAKWRGATYANELRKGSIHTVEIRWVKETIGYGLFASQPIKKWEFVGQYTGLVKKCDFFYRNINDYCFRYPLHETLFGIWNIYTIDAKKQANETSFINHSDCPNCESFTTFTDGLLRVCIRATQDIQAGEELTFDYGSDILKEQFQEGR